MRILEIWFILVFIFVLHLSYFIYFIKKYFYKFLISVDLLRIL